MPKSREKEPLDQESASSADRVDAARKNPLFVNSLQKGFQVLRAFSNERRALSLAAITKATGLDKSATQRFVFTLHSLGYLRKDPSTKMYSISPRMLEFGYSYLHSDYLVETTQPFLVKAHEQTGETVNLAVLDGEDIIIVSRIPSKQVVSVNVHIGSRIPALYSASGRAICAFLEKEEQDALLNHTIYEKYTEHSVTDPLTMRQLVQVARVDGYSITRSQYFWGDISIAAPVFDAAGKVAAALSVAAPETRMTIQGAQEELVSATVSAAKMASAALSRM